MAASARASASTATIARTTNSSPPNARHEVAAAHRRRQPHPDLAQHAVAHRVPVGIVDALEVVDVDEEDRQRLAAAIDEGAGVLEASLERAAVRQVRQRVAQRERGPGLGAGACGDLSLEHPHERDEEHDEDAHRGHRVQD